MGQAPKQLQVYTEMCNVCEYPIFLENMSEAHIQTELLGLAEWRIRMRLAARARAGLCYC